MLLSFFPLVSFSAAVVESGTCGANLIWTLDSDGLLTISGTGAIDHYSSSSSVPWGSSVEERERIKTVLINPGVTSIGDYAFFKCTELTRITIPAGVTSIGNFAFDDCTGFTIIIPASVTEIGIQAVPAHTVIYGAVGSYAQTWAQENNRVFKTLDGLPEQTEHFGDVNGDDKITAADARLIHRAAVGLQTLG